MSLKTAIQFRFLAAQLTQAETLQFVNKLLHGDNNIIIKALFNQILLNTSTNRQSEADNINNTISNIIQSRKKKPKPIPIQNIKLDQLPKRLIGEISSFLDQYDNIDFSKTNRFIYLGCNSPNLLQLIHLSDLENYSSINFGLFPSVKDLTLHLNKFNKLIPSIKGLIMNELETIELDADGKNDIDIDNFLEFNHINTNNITKLACLDFGNLNIDFSADKFMKLLKKFPNIQYLDFYGVIVGVDVDKVKDLYPNLKGLTMDGLYEVTTGSLINTFGNNLDFLSFVDHNTDFNLQHTNFDKLKELKLTTPTMKSIDNILLSAKNLNKVAIDSTAKKSTWQTPKETKKIMTKLIKTCKSLQYIEFNVDYAVDSELLEPAMDGIENGLFETQKWIRNEMKIRIDIKCNDRLNPSDFILNIRKIIHWLDSSEINDFMFIFSLEKLSKKIDKNILFKELKSKCLSKNVNVDKVNSDYAEDTTLFIFTNSECKINGLLESWKM